MNEPQISVTSLSPTYDAAKQEFRQAFTFRSPFPLDSDRIKRIVDTASRMFAGSMQMNNLGEFAWPPDMCQVQGQKDFKGGMITFMTRACRPRPIILDS